MTDSSPEATAELWGLIERIAEAFGRAVVPVFHACPPALRRPKFVGSSVLVRTSDRIFAFTANHVLEEEMPPGNQLMLSFEGGLLQMPSWTRLELLDALRGSARALDVAWIELHAAQAREMGIWSLALDLEGFLLQAPPAAEEYYLAIGFPGTKADKRVGKQLHPTPAAIFASEVEPSAYRQLGFDPGFHIAVGFPQEKMASPAGSGINAPKPKGMSGGALFRMYATERGGLLDLNLAGILIRWERFGPKAIVATRIDPIIEALKQTPRPEQSA